MIGPEKTSLFYVHKIHLFGIYLFSVCMCHTKSESFIEFLRIFCAYDAICAKIHPCTIYMLGKRKTEILCIDKTCFLRTVTYVSLFDYIRSYS